MGLEVIKTYSFDVDFGEQVDIPDLDPVTSEYNVFYLDMNMKNDNQPIDLTGMTVEVHYSRPDMEIYIQTDDIDIKNEVSGKVVVKVNPTAFAKQGTVGMEVILLEFDEKVVSKHYEFEVREPIYNENNDTLEDTTHIKDYHDSQVNGHTFWSGTQTEYDNLTSYEDKTLYFIQGGGVWLGTIQIAD